MNPSYIFFILMTETNFRSPEDIPLDLLLSCKALKLPHEALFLFLSKSPNSCVMDGGEMCFGQLWFPEDTSPLLILLQHYQTPSGNFVYTLWFPYKINQNNIHVVPPFELNVSMSVSREDNLTCLILGC